MKINAIAPEQAISKYAQAAMRPKQAAQTVMQADKVELSASAMSFAQVIKTAKALMQTNESDSSRVAAISSKVRTGTYQVDGMAIASRMLSGIAGVEK